MQNREVEILAKGREADFGMNEFPSGGSKLSYRGIRHPASFHWPLNSRNTVGEEMQGVSFVHTHTRGSSLNISPPAPPVSCGLRLRLSTQVTSLKNQLFQLRGIVAKNNDLTSKEDRSIHTKVLLFMSERGGGVSEGSRGRSTSREYF